MFANRDFLPRYARLRNDEHLGMKEKKKGKNCGAIFPFLILILPQIHVFSSEARNLKILNESPPIFFKKKYPMRKFRILSIFLCYKEIKLSGYENNKTNGL